MDKEKIAYNGKYAHFKGKLYVLVPELKKHMCEGCDLYNRECSREITELCTQGFILKKASK